MKVRVNFRFSCEVANPLFAIDIIYNNQQCRTIENVKKLISDKLGIDSSQFLIENSPNDNQICKILNGYKFKISIINCCQDIEFRFSSNNYTKTFTVNNGYKEKLSAIIQIFHQSGLYFSNKSYHNNLQFRIKGKKVLRIDHPFFAVPKHTKVAMMTVGNFIHLKYYGNHYFYTENETAGSAYNILRKQFKQFANDDLISITKNQTKEKLSKNYKMKCNEEYTISIKIKVTFRCKSFKHHDLTFYFECFDSVLCAEHFLAKEYSSDEFKKFYIVIYDKSQNEITDKCMFLKEFLSSDNIIMYDLKPKTKTKHALKTNLIDKSFSDVDIINHIEKKKYDDDDCLAKSLKFHTDTELYSDDDDKEKSFDGGDDKEKAFDDDDDADSKHVQIKFKCENDESNLLSQFIIINIQIDSKLDKIGEIIKDKFKTKDFSIWYINDKNQKILIEDDQTLTDILVNIRESKKKESINNTFLIQKLDKKEETPSASSRKPAKSIKFFRPKKTKNLVKSYTDSDTSESTIDSSKYDEYLYKVNMKKEIQKIRLRKEATVGVFKTQISKAYKDINLSNIQVLFGGKEINDDIFLSSLAIGDDFLYVNIVNFDDFLIKTAKALKKKSSKSDDDELHYKKRVRINFKCENDELNLILPFSLTIPIDTKLNKIDEIIKDRCEIDNFSIYYKDSKNEKIQINDDATLADFLNRILDKKESINNTILVNTLSEKIKSNSRSRSSTKKFKPKKVLLSKKVKKEDSKNDQDDEEEESSEYYNKKTDYEKSSEEESNYSEEEIKENKDDDDNDDDNDDDDNDNDDDNDDDDNDYEPKFVKISFQFEGNESEKFSPFIKEIPVDITYDKFKDKIKSKYNTGDISTIYLNNKGKKIMVEDDTTLANILHSILESVKKEQASNKFIIKFKQKVKPYPDFKQSSTSIENDYSDNDYDDIFLDDDESNKNQNENNNFRFLSTSLIEKFTKTEIGRGVTSDVYRVKYDKYPNKTFVLKTYRSAFIKKENENNSDEQISNEFEKMRKFFFEYEVITKLNHPNIIKSYGFYLGDKTHQPSILLEYCPSNLKEKIKELTKEERVKIAIELSEAMETIHENGIIHRDLKPENILLDSNNVLKVTDFGMGTLIDIGTLSRSGKVGTLGYMAPEIIKEDKHYGKKVDVYSFGHVYYFIISKGELPDFSLLERINSFTEISRSLIIKCLSEKPDDRPDFTEICEILKKNKNKLI